MKTLEQVKSEQVDRCIYENEPIDNLIDMVSRAYAIEAIKADREQLHQHIEAVCHWDIYHLVHIDHSSILNAPYLPLP